MIPDSRSVLPVADILSNGCYLLAGVWAVAYAPGPLTWGYLLVMLNLAAGSFAFHARITRTSSWDVSAMNAVLLYLLLVTAAIPLATDAVLLAVLGSVGLGWLMRCGQLRLRVGSEWGVAGIIGAIVLFAIATGLPLEGYTIGGLVVGAVALFVRVFAPPETHWWWHLSGALATAYYAVGLVT